MLLFYIKLKLNIETQRGEVFGQLIILEVFMKKELRELTQEVLNELGEETEPVKKGLFEDFFSQAKLYTVIG